MTSPSEIPLQQTINALLDVDAALNPRFIYRFSDLEPSELEQLSEVWPRVPLWRRQALMEDIEKLSASDYLLDFVAFARLALTDDEAQIRLLAIHTLWEYEDQHLIPVLLETLQKDTDPDVRAAAAGALGRFVYAGEIEEISQKKLRSIENVLLDVISSDESAQTRRSALESLGYSSRAEVKPLIEKAFNSSDRSWKASALKAMGRSASQAWKPAVMSMIESNFPLLRSEAARAAGELELKAALPFLHEMLDDPDENARMASIWSLSQIGGEGVRETLESDDGWIDEEEMDDLFYDEEE